MNDFHELINDRKSLLEVMKKPNNNFNFEEIFSGLYDDPSHFIYELIQNAEDQKAKTVSFNLFDDRLEFYHDGVSFSYKDVASITSIGNSTKKDDANKIGKFGIGFKSVYAITNTPEIYSKTYSFNIKDLVLPELIETQYNSEITKFIFKFEHKKRSKDEIYNLIKNKLIEIDVRTILFLNYIQKLEWRINQNSEGIIEKKVNIIDDQSSIVMVSEITKKNDEKWLVFKRKVNSEDNNELDLKVEIAYKIEFNDKTKTETIREINDSKLVVYFPTNIDTRLKFLVQGPYKTTPARDNVPPSDEWNLKLNSEISTLISDSILSIKKLGFLNPAFLNILPINESDFPVKSRFRSAYEKVFEKLMSDEQLIPTDDAGYVEYKNAYYVENSRLLNLLAQNNNLNILTKNMSARLIHSDVFKYRDLALYFRQKMRINIIDGNKFADLFDVDFISKQSDEWVADFYYYLSKSVSLWQKKSAAYASDGLLRNKPFIRLENNSHIKPFNENERPQVFLFDENNTYFSMVKKRISESDITKDFFNLIGIKKPDEIDEVIKFILPLYNSNVLPSVDQNISHINKIMDIFRKDIPNKQLLIQKLKETRIFLGLNKLTRKSSYFMPDELFLPLKYSGNDMLEKFFEGNPEINFLTEEYEDIFKNNDNDFLNKLGFKSSPVDKKSIFKEPVIIGIDNLLNKISVSKSCVLWRFIIDAFKRNINPFYFSTANNPKQETEILKMLKTKSWLPNKKDKKFYPPLSMLISDLPDEFDIESNEAKKVIKELSFMQGSLLEAINKISDDKCRDKLKIALELDIEDLNEALRRKREKAEIQIDESTPKVAEINERNTKKRPSSVDQTENFNNEIWVPECSEIDDVKVTRATSSDIKCSDDFQYECDNEETETTGVKKRKMSNSESLKNIGFRGELTVIKFLKEVYYKELYPSAIWKTCDGENIFALIDDGKEILKLELVNSSKVNAIGRDIDVTENGIRKYFEVKTDDWIMPSRAQWNKAKELKENYYICKVYNVGKSESQVEIIQNPYEAWRKILDNPYKDWENGNYRVLPRINYD